MYESVYAMIWLIAAGFFAIQAIWKRGGVMSSTATMGMFVILYFTSTDVTASTSAGLVSTSNPTAGWIALYMAFLSAIIVLFSLLGMWGEEKEDNEQTITSDRPQSMTGISDRL